MRKGKMAAQARARQMKLKKRTAAEKRTAEKNSPSALRRRERRAHLQSTPKGADGGL